MQSPPKVIGRKRDREEYERSCSPSLHSRDERLSGGIFKSYVVKGPQGKRQRIVTSPGQRQTRPRRKRAKGLQEPSAHASQSNILYPSASVNTGTFISSLDYSASQIFGNLQLPGFLNSTTGHSANTERSTLSPVDESDKENHREYVEDEVDGQDEQDEQDVECLINEENIDDSVNAKEEPKNKHSVAGANESPKTSSPESKSKITNVLTETTNEVHDIPEHPILSIRECEISKHDDKQVEYKTKLEKGKKRDLEYEAYKKKADEAYEAKKEVEKMERAEMLWRHSSKAPYIKISEQSRATSSAQVQDELDPSVQIALLEQCHPIVLDVKGKGVPGRPPKYPAKDAAAPAQVEEEVAPESVPKEMTTPQPSQPSCASKAITVVIPESPEDESYEEDSEDRPVERQVAEAQISPEIPIIRRPETIIPRVCVSELTEAFEPKDQLGNEECITREVDPLPVPESPICPIPDDEDDDLFNTAGSDDESGIRYITQAEIDELKEYEIIVEANPDCTESTVLEEDQNEASVAAASVETSTAQGSPSPSRAAKRRSPEVEEIEEPPTKKQRVAEEEEEEEMEEMEMDYYPPAIPEEPANDAFDVFMRKERMLWYGLPAGMMRGARPDLDERQRGSFIVDLLNRGYSAEEERAHLPAQRVVKTPRVVLRPLYGQQKKRRPSHLRRGFTAEEQEEEMKKALDARKASKKRKGARRKTLQRKKTEEKPMEEDIPDPDVQVMMPTLDDSFCAEREYETIKFVYKPLKFKKGRKGRRGMKKDENEPLIRAFFRRRKKFYDAIASRPKDIIFIHNGVELHFNGNLDPVYVANILANAIYIDLNHLHHNIPNFLQYVTNIVNEDANPPIVYHYHTPEPPVHTGQLAVHQGVLAQPAPTVIVDGVDEGNSLAEESDADHAHVMLDDQDSTNDNTGNDNDDDGNDKETMSTPETRDSLEEIQRAADERFHTEWNMIMPSLLPFTKPREFEEATMRAFRDIPDPVIPAIEEPPAPAAAPANLSNPEVNVDSYNGFLDHLAAQSSTLVAQRVRAAENYLAPLREEAAEIARLFRNEHLKLIREAEEKIAAEEAAANEGSGQ